MSTKCVLCRSACFTEHLSADLRVVCSRRVDEGGVGPRTIVSQHNSVSKKKGFAAVFAAAPWYPWKQTLICICLIVGRGEQTVTEARMWGIVENSVCHQLLLVTIRSATSVSLHSGLHHRHGAPEAEEEFSQCS